jgi:hypothetical protein
MKMFKCSKATSSNHIWNEGFSFSVEDVVEHQHLQLALIQKGLSGSQVVGMIRCPVKDILVFYLAHKAGAVKSSEARVEVLDGKSSFCARGA